MHVDDPTVIPVKLLLPKTIAGNPPAPCRTVSGVVNEERELQFDVQLSTQRSPEELGEQVPLTNDVELVLKTPTPQSATQFPLHVVVCNVPRVTLGELPPVKLIV